MSRCKIKTVNSTYESAVRRELDGGLVCEAAEDHVFLKQGQTISTDLFIRGVISKKTNKQTNKQKKTLKLCMISVYIQVTARMGNNHWSDQSDIQIIPQRGLFFIYFFYTMNHATPLCMQKDKSMREFVLFIYSSHLFLHLLILFTAVEAGRDAGKRPLATANILQNSILNPAQSFTPWLFLQAKLILA